MICKGKRVKTSTKQGFLSMPTSQMSVLARGTEHTSLLALVGNIRAYISNLAYLSNMIPLVSICTYLRICVVSHSAHSTLQCVVLFGKRH